MKLDIDGTPLHNDAHSNNQQLQNQAYKRSPSSLKQATQDLPNLYLSLFAIIVNWVSGCLPPPLFLPDSHLNGYCSTKAIIFITPDQWHCLCETKFSSSFLSKDQNFPRKSKNLQRRKVSKTSPKVAIIASIQTKKIYFHLHRSTVNDQKDHCHS